MLENSNLITGKDAKEVETLIKKYEDVSIQLADLEKTKKEVTAKIFELTEIGINETSNLVFNIVDNKGRETISIKSLNENAPDILDELRAKNLVNVGNNYKTIKGIKHKTNI